MARILGLWFWMVTSAVAALLLSTAIDLVLSVFARLLGLEIGAELNIAPRWLALAIAALLVLPFLPRVRRWLWRLPWIGSQLRKHVFEDLDGDWTVEIDSNWPTVEAMWKASRDANEERFDPVSNPDTMCEGVPFRFDATITMGWAKAEVIIYPNKSTPLQQSRTIIFELIRKCADYPPRVFWGFRQFNSSVEATDEDNFLGAAMLDVVSADELTGTYWNNRSWRKGLNVAGRITMKRRP
ncbi:hypothetical protein [Maricaulis sp. CAU 1757]